MEFKASEAALGGMYWGKIPSVQSQGEDCFMAQPNMPTEDQGQPLSCLFCGAALFCSPAFVSSPFPEKQKILSTDEVCCLVPGFIA